MEIECRLKAIRKDRPFGRVHVCPDSSMDVSDEQDVGLVILKYHLDVQIQYAEGQRYSGGREHPEYQWHCTAYLP